MKKNIKNNKNIKIGFIGCGNMAFAMIAGISKQNTKKSSKLKYSIIASNPSLDKLKKVKKDFNIEITQNNKKVAQVADIIIIAVKPKFYKKVIKEISSYINPNTIIVSITIGYTISHLEDFFTKNTKNNKKIKIIRAMPNTPCMVSEGMSALCKNKNVSNKEFNIVCNIFQCFSKTAIIEEDLFDSVVAVSGSAPAYVYMFIEALADGAVLQGMSRELAYKFASQTVLGSAKMVLETNTHPAILKDNVCSPAGSTIEAIKILEDNAFRGSIINAMEYCAEKSKKIKN